MGARATTRHCGMYVELEKGIPFSRNFSSICWKIAVINMQIHSDPCEWFPLELCSVQLVPLSMAALEGGVQYEGLPLSPRESEKVS